jgi:hypothetical protein
MYQQLFYFLTVNADESANIYASRVEPKNINKDYFIAVYFM